MHVAFSYFDGVVLANVKVRNIKVRDEINKYFMNKKFWNQMNIVMIVDLFHHLLM